MSVKSPPLWLCKALETVSEPVRRATGFDLGWRLMQSFNPKLDILRMDDSSAQPGHYGLQDKKHTPMGTFGGFYPRTPKF
ncbi:MAG TPA: hypothetical protein PKX87_04470 [Alphaproteobacteria bacterium]|nr:hypothetical protein [Alphaproteobacteria bacterium]